MMDKSWAEWTEVSLQRGCDPKSIRDILVNEGRFDLATIRNAMGSKFPDPNCAPDAVPDVTGVDHQALYDVCAKRLRELPNAKQIETDKVQLFTIDKFLTADECDGVVDLINNHLRPSELTFARPGYRTSYSSDLGYLDHELIHAVDRKMSMTLGIRLSHADTMQAQKYQIGQEFKPHMDYFHPGSEEFRLHCDKGNRTWTFMVYLMDTPKGGGTRFVNLDLTFYPRKGNAVVWNNLYADGRPNPDTLHCGMPVKKGEKAIITKWFREIGDGPMFYCHAC